MAKVHVIWEVTTSAFPDPADPNTGFIGDQARDLYYQYQRLRDEDRPVLIKVYGDFGGSLAGKLKEVGLPAEEVRPFRLPVTVLKCRDHFLLPQ